MGTNRSQSKIVEVICAFQSDVNHKRVNAIFLSPAKLLTDVVSRPNALSHVGYGNRDANGDRRPRHYQTKTVFPFSHAGGGLPGIRTQSMSGHSTTFA